MDPLILPSPTRHAPTEIPQSLHKLNESAPPRLASFSSTRDSSISWGRRQHHGTWLHALGCASIMTFCPLLVIFYWIALSSFHGSLVAAWKAMWTVGPIRFVWSHAPQSDYRVHVAYAGYLLFQAGLYQFLPGKLSVGQITPAGHLLKYRTNGLFAWALTHLLFGAWILHGYVDPAIIARHYEPLLVTSNCYGFALPMLVYVKAHVFPTHARDRKFSGELLLPLSSNSS
jgi:7-dehydrocholesterol reductase